ncbi:coiled-coil domain-containing protein 18 isoform X2 [Bufo bufo]|nr:coiled-coil domain-containing protein 18 isoform X2 [Bufo bufo]XP_040263824.1 coiled-coil domain-containing protein 18 isoform X2 [Bufo bufo]XP_040263825.1 coiled-coil domain-containing protein 18 isoform X2 [Bufo bufo]
MESSASRYRKKHLFGKTLNAENKQLIQTEGTLCDPARRSSDSGSEHSLSRAPLGLTLEDLEQPNHCAPRESVPRQRNTMFLSAPDSLRTGQDKTGSLRSTEQENKKLRDKLLILQEQNAALTTQNRSLRSRMESVQLELANCKSKPSSKQTFDVHFGARTFRIPDLEEQVASLEAESEAQEKALRIAEDKLVESHHKMAEKEQILQKFREELKKMKMELSECNKCCKRAEKQRNEALLNAEELTRAFQQYKRNVAEKLEKVKAEGDLVNKNLQNFERERGDLLEKCTNLENELENLREHLRNVMSEKTDEKEKQKSVELKNLELISLLTQSNQRVLRLESGLENKEKVLQDNITLMNENKELKERLMEMANQNEVKQCGSESVGMKLTSQLKNDFSDLERLRNNMSENVNKLECDNNRSLLAELRAKLLKKEAENQELQAKIFIANSSHTLDTEPVKLTLQQSEIEKFQRFESVSKELQEENERLTDTVRELKRKLSKAQAETANAKLSMAQRTSQFQLIQEELLEKASKTTKLEQEMTKKSLKIASLQKLLEDKTETYSGAVARNAKLEEELRDFKAQIRNLEENISKEHQEVIMAFEKSKTVYLDRQNELLKQIEDLSCQLEMKNLEAAEQEFTINNLQEDAASKQMQLEALDNKLVEARKELELHRKGAADKMKILENLLETEAVTVKQLESALAVCKKELGLYFQQLEENREHFENQTKKKSEEVHCLQKEMKFRTQNLQETTEENVRLRQTLHQQQQMLQQATTRIGDLEDTQAELEKQVSKLEFELEKQRSSSQVDLKAAEEALQVANEELACKAHNVHELGDTVSQLKDELDLCKEKLNQAEIKLMTATVERESKSDKLSQLELMLQRTQSDLSDKTQLVALLQERVAIAENDLIKKGEMTMDLQKSTKLVEELQEALTKTRLSVEEKEVIIQTLREELRTCKAELEERDHELLDLDQALKDRNWELKQRAAQLTHLDMSIREHKEELQLKISHLERTLKKSELETKDYIKQISNLDETLQKAKGQLREKDFELLQKDQHITQLQNEAEKKQQTIMEMEQTIGEQQKSISEQHQEGNDLSQQVRLARERMQFTQLELMETRQQLAESQKESDRLTRKLEAMDLQSREEMQHLKQNLDDAQDTIANLKTELEARNEVIKATNEVLILKESELTRLKARISGYERSLALKQMPNHSSLSPDIFGGCQALESYKLPESSDLNWNMDHSLSDLSLSDVSSVDFKNRMEGMKNFILSDSSLARIASDKNVLVPSDNFTETSFNPLEHAVDHCNTTCDTPDLGTLSGMLKYIKEEMNLSEGL